MRAIWEFFSGLWWRKANRELIEACYAGDIEGVKKALNEGANINTKFEVASPLDYAFYCEDLSGEGVVKFLLEKGAVLYLRGKYDSLWLAVQYGWDEVVEILLARGEEINCEDSEGNTLLHLVTQKWPYREEALRCLKKERVAKLLLEHTLEVDVKNHRDETPLMIAVRWGAEKMVKLLLEHGAVVDSVNIDGKTPLHIAATAHNQKVFELLLEYGADVTTQVSGNNFNQGKDSLSLILDYPYSMTVNIVELLQYSLIVTPEHLRLASSSIYNQKDLTCAYIMQQIINFLPLRLKSLAPFKETVAGYFIKYNDGDLVPRIYHEKGWPLWDPEKVYIRLFLYVFFEKECVIAAITGSNFLNNGFTQEQLNIFINALEIQANATCFALQKINEVKIMVERLYSIILYEVRPDLFPQETKEGHPLTQGPKAYKDSLEIAGRFYGGGAKFSSSEAAKAAATNTEEQPFVIAKDLELSKGFIHPIYTEAGKAELRKLSLAQIAKILASFTTTTLSEEVAEVLKNPMLKGQDKKLFKAWEVAKVAMQEDLLNGSHEEEISPVLGCDDYQDNDSLESNMQIGPNEG
jgi:hypothetical protein